MNTKERTRRITALGMICAAAYAAVVFGRIPIVLFLKYEPKDVVIVIGGLLFGPLAALAVSAIVSLIEMFTISSDGIIGLLMNVIATCSFVFPAAILYRRKRTQNSVLFGLLAGWVLMTAIMLLWNYLITPVYLGIPRQAVVELLWPAILPFNLIKGGLNAGIAFLLYKPVVGALEKTGLVPKDTAAQNRFRIGPGVVLVTVLVLGSCVLLALALNGII